MFIKSQNGNYYNLLTASHLRVIKSQTNDELYFVTLGFDRKEESIFTTTDLKMAEYIVEEVISAYSANHKICATPYNFRLMNEQQKLSNNEV